MAAAGTSHARLAVCICPLSLLDVCCHYPRPLTSPCTPSHIAWGALKQATRFFFWFAYRRLSRWKAIRRPQATVTSQPTSVAGQGTSITGHATPSTSSSGRRLQTAKGRPGTSLAFTKAVFIGFHKDDFSRTRPPNHCPHPLERVIQLVAFNVPIQHKLLMNKLYKPWLTEFLGSGPHNLGLGWCRCVGVSVYRTPNCNRICVKLRSSFGWERFDRLC